MNTTTVADWAAYTSLAVGAYATGCAFLYLLVDASLADFDPRPLVRRVLDTDVAARLLVALFNAQTAVREACLDAAALIVLLTTSPKGATS